MDSYYKEKKIFKKGVIYAAPCINTNTDEIG